MMKTRLNELRSGGWGATRAGGAVEDWATTVKHLIRDVAPTVDQAASRGPMSFEEALAS